MYGGERRSKIKWADVWAVRGTGALEVTDATYALPEVMEHAEETLQGDTVDQSDFSKRITLANRHDDAKQFHGSSKLNLLFSIE